MLGILVHYWAASYGGSKQKNDLKKKSIVLFFLEIFSI